MFEALMQHTKITVRNLDCELEMVKNPYQLLKLLKTYTAKLDLAVLEADHLLKEVERGSNESSIS